MGGFAAFCACTRSLARDLESARRESSFMWFVRRWGDDHTIISRTSHDHTCRSMRCHAVLPFTFCSATQRHGTEKSNDCRRHELLLCSLWELLQISALTPALVDHCTSNERDDLPPRHCQQCEKLFCRPAKGEEEASAFHYE